LLEARLHKKKRSGKNWILVQKLGVLSDKRLKTAPFLGSAKKGAGLRVLGKT
jgi:hypothetical protein